MVSLSVSLLLSPHIINFKQIGLGAFATITASIALCAMLAVKILKENWLRIGLLNQFSFIIGLIPIN